MNQIFEDSKVNKQTKEHCPFVEIPRSLTKIYNFVVPCASRQQKGLF